MLLKLFILMLAPVAIASPQSVVYFDASASDRMLLGNASFELALSKTNGGILALLDKAANANVTLGSRGGCLWGSLFRYPGPTPDYVGGCSYSAGGANRFSYSWNPAASVLTLQYTHDPAASRGVDATVAVAVSPGQYVDLALTIQNHWDAGMGEALFPSDLLFSANSVQAGYLPFQFPGVRLKPSWFQSGMTFGSNYPGLFNFADYLALDVAGGHLAYYSINPTGPIQPVLSGFLRYSGDAPDRYVMTHNYQSSTPPGGAYRSPTVRLWVGAVPKDTILSYREDNGIGNYRTISQKLGSAFGRLARSPLVKLDLVQINKTFAALVPELASLPVTLLIHPVAYSYGGFDHSYPDFLPPDPRWGTTDDFRAFVNAAHAQGQLVMPYINPTWWKAESPTLSNLPSPLLPADLAVQTPAGQPVSDTYGSNTGIRVSPWPAFVKQRLDVVMTQWRNDVPVGLIFEDQIGARPWDFDYNPSSPSPLSYSDGWLNWWDSYAAQGEMTEDGWDRLAASGIGFCGSPLTHATSFDFASQRYGIGSNGNTILGAGNWDPYPLVTWLMHDKALFYQHDLAQAITTDANEIVAWDLAFGNILKYNWQALGTPRASLGDALQNAVGPYYAGQTLDDFAYLTPDVTASTFGPLTVIANWQQTSAYAIDGHGILPGGYLARTSDGALTAGSFVGSFNSAPITAGEHHIIVQRAGRTILVRQPVGADTDLTISLPPDWAVGDLIAVTAVDRAGVALGATAFTRTNSNIVYRHAAQAGSGVADHYEIRDLTPPSGCTYTTSPGGLAIASAGGTGAITVAAADGCPWSVSGLPTWIAVAGAASGTGNGAVTIQIAANLGGWRSATLTVGGHSFVVEQSSTTVSGLTTVGAMPQVASGGGWETAIVLANLGTSAAQARLNFFADKGSALPLPMIFPQTPSGGPLMGSQLERTIAPGAEVVIQTSGAGMPAVAGWAQLQTNGGITGYARFNWTVGGGVQEAVVPLESRTPSSFVLSYDQTGGFGTGVAVANVTGQNANVAVMVRDDTGAVVGSESLQLAGWGHTAYMVADHYPATGQGRGTVEFKTPAGGQIATLAFRANAAGTLSTIPSLVK